MRALRLLAILGVLVAPGIAFAQSAPPAGNPPQSTPQPPSGFTPNGICAYDC